MYWHSDLIGKDCVCVEQKLFVSPLLHSFSCLFSLPFRPIYQLTCSPSPTERFQMVMLNSTVNTLDVCEVCGSYQCPYCPIYSSAPSLNLPNIGFLISVALLTYVYQVFSESRSFAGSRWPGGSGSGSGSVWWEEVCRFWIVATTNACVFLQTFLLYGESEFVNFRRISFPLIENVNFRRNSFPLMEIMCKVSSRKKL